MLRNSLLMLSLLATRFVVGQGTGGHRSDFVYSSPSGNYIMLNLDGKAFTPDLQKGYTIERSQQGDSRFTRIGVFAPVQSYSEFQDIVGAELATDFKRYIKAKSDADVVKFFNSPHAAKEYGFYVFDINFLRAMGMVYLDPVSQDRMGGYEYQLKGSSGQVIRKQSPVVFRKESLPRGQVKKIYTTDSLVSIRWEFASYTSDLPLLGRIYKQEDGKGRYYPEPTRTTINAVDKGSYAMYERSTTPEHLTNYYIVPVDILGNEGYPSDTATAITIDYKKMPGVQDIYVRDSMGGLFSFWKQLPAKPYYTGIQVLRSRDARKDFLVIDTVAADAVSYLDKQVLPNVTYFYKFRPLVYKLSGWDEIIATTVHASMGSSRTAPLAPVNLSAVKEGRNIRVSWEINSELDVFAYYVLRGTSERNMEIVSPAIIDDSTWLDSSATLSGRANYVYSVVAMNNNQVKSAASNSAGMSPARGEFIAAPTGITIRASGRSLLLTWPDVGRNDVAVAGYVLYKKKKGEKDYMPVINELIRTPFYEDAKVEVNTGYEYAVSAVDRFGYESMRSPDAAFRLTERIVPPAVIYVRKLSSSVEISWPENSGQDIVGYNIYRKTPADKDFVKIATVKPAEGLFNDRKYVAGKLNIYAVAISTANGDSGLSTEKTVFVDR